MTITMTTVHEIPLFVIIGKEVCKGMRENEKDLAYLGFISMSARCRC